MLSACRGCGANASRTLARYDERLNFMGEVCPECRPELFEGAFRAPSDNKIYPGPVAFPNQYKRDSEGVYHAKDEILQDTVNEWDKGPTQKGIDRRRATRRTTPMTADEIERAKAWAISSGLADAAH